MASELPQRPLAHSGAELTWTRVGGTELRVGAPAPARGERFQARPEPPPQSGAYAFEAISAPMIVSTRRGSPDAVPTSSYRVCTSSAAVWTQDARDTSPNGLSGQGGHPPTAPSPPTDSIQGKSGPTGQRHLQGMPVPGAPQDTYLRPQDTYPQEDVLGHCKCG